MRAEADLIKTLPTITRHNRSGERDVFFARGRAVMELRLLPDAELPPIKEALQLHSRKWLLTAIKGRELSKPTEAFLNFDRAKGSAGGNSGCNVFGGNYTDERGKLKIFGVISTMRACIEDERMNIERAFMDAIESANRYEIRAGVLNLYKGSELLLTLRGVPK
jgi:heat shock protein HslJ